MIGSWSAPPSSEPTSASSRRRSRSYATRTAARSPPRRGDAVSSSSPTGSKLRASVERIAGSGWSSRASSWSSGRRSSASDVWSRAVASSVSAISRNCSGSRRPPRAARSIAGPMSCDAADPDARPLGEQGAGLVGLVEAAGDDDRVRSWLERLREPLARAGTRSRPRAARGRAGTRGARSSGRPSSPSGSGRARATRAARPTALAGSTKRHGTVGPRLAGVARSRPAVSRRPPDAGSPAGAASSAERRRRVEQVEPGHRAVDRERGRDEPGPAGEAPPPGAARSRAASRVCVGRRLRRLRRRPPPARAARRASRRRPRAARRRGRAPPRVVRSASVTMFRQSYIP